MNQGLSGLGEFLRSEREKRGITLEQVASATKVGLRMLQALEAEQWNELPAKPFVRGFTMAYARFVGLDLNDVLTKFGPAIEERAREGAQGVSSSSEGYVYERRDENRSKTLLLIGLGSILVVGGVTLMILKPALKHGRKSHLERLNSVYPSPSPALSPETQTPSPSILLSPTPVASPMPMPSATPGAIPSPLVSTAVPEVKLEKLKVPAVTTTPSPAPSPNATPKPTPSPAVSAAPSPAASPKSATTSTSSIEPNRIPKESDPSHKGDALPAADIRIKSVFKTSEDVWVRYKVDDRLMVKYPLRKGSEIVLRGKDAVSIEFSNPAAIQIRTPSKAYAPFLSEPSLVKESGQTVFFVTKDSDKLSRSTLLGQPALPAEVPPQRSAATPSPSPTP